MLSFRSVPKLSKIDIASVKKGMLPNGHYVHDEFDKPES